MGLIGTLGVVELYTEGAPDDVGRDVLGILKSFQRAGQVDALFTTGEKVKAKICVYKEGTGAVTLYKAKVIKISKDMAGGPQEMAEFIVYELLNWKKGDFATAAYTSVKDGTSSLIDAGKKMASIEADVTYRHAEILRKLRTDFGATLSKQGTRNVDAVGTFQTPSGFQKTFFLTQHDVNAKPPNPASLPTPEMYAYEIVENRDPSVILGPTLLRGLVPAPPAWFTDFVTESVKQIVEYQRITVKGQVHVTGDTRGQVYLKLAKLAHEYGMRLRDGYEFTPAMKHVAETPVLSGQFQANLKTYVLKNLMGSPPDLQAKLQAVGILG